MVRDPRLVMRGTGWTIARRQTGGHVHARYIDGEDAITVDIKAGALKARVTDEIGSLWRHPSQPLYTRLGLEGSVYVYR